MMEATAQELTVARALAETWVNAGIDLNEVGKLIAYLRANGDWGKTLELARRLAESGAVRSQQTRRYYQTIYKECVARISKDANAKSAGQILGWAFRLGRYRRQVALTTTLGKAKTKR